MRRAYLGVLFAVVLPAISVYSQGTRGGSAFRSGVRGRAVVARSNGFHGGYRGLYGRGYGRGYYYRYEHGGGVIVYGYGYYPYGYVVPVDTSDSAVYPPS